VDIRLGGAEAAFQAASAYCLGFLGPVDCFIGKLWVSFSNQSEKEKQIGRTALEMARNNHRPTIDRVIPTLSEAKRRNLLSSRAAMSLQVQEKAGPSASLRSASR